MHKLRFAIAKAGVHALRFSGFYQGYWQHWRGALFDYAEKFGVHILPVHYYTPIPAESDFARPRRKNNMTGIDLDVAGGLDRAHKLLEKYKDQVTTFLNGAGKYDPQNTSFHPLDAAILYASVREARPRRIIEIGSGMSTHVILEALRNAEMPETNFTCIEPYLPDYLKNSRKGITEVIERPLQEVPLDKFRELEANDILFIDSTHVVRFDSDVVYEILEILPILKPGVIVHVHDIFFPDDYPKAWLQQFRFFWAEQYMLQAFLSMNPNFKIDIPVNAIKSSLLLNGTMFPVAADIPAVSLWMRRI